MKPAHWFKSGVASFFPLLDSAKEGGKGFIHPSQDILATVEIREGQVTTSADVPKLVGLLVVGD
jgi:hypothetical protein